MMAFGTLELRHVVLHPSSLAAGCQLEALRLLTPSDDGLRRALAAVSVDVPVEKAARPGMEMRLRCPKGPVRFQGDGFALL